MASLEQRFLDEINATLANVGLDAVAVWVPADDPTTDDEIEFRTRDGSATYPVAIQVGDGYNVMVVYEFDAAGDLVGACHGLDHGMTGWDGLGAEGLSALRKSPPRAAAATSGPAPRR
jgi:hypothetical protein